MGKNFHVTLQPEGWQFQCAAEQTVLLAALAAGLRMPHACRNGTCRACLAQLVDGQIVHGIEWPGLSREEKADGLILPCVARPLSDLVIQAPSTRCISDASAPDAQGPAAA